MRRTAIGRATAPTSSPMPTVPASACGPSTVQIQRMLDPSRYAAAASSDRSSSSTSARSMPRAARSTSRTRPSRCRRSPVICWPRVERGVDVVMLVPAIAEQYVYEARQDPRAGGAVLGHRGARPPREFHPGGTGRASRRPRRAAYVHAKLMLVDDVWATVGSCNLHPFSLAGHTEMNASIWDAAVARDLRCRLFAQHLGVDTTSLDDRAALRQLPGHRPRQPAQAWRAARRSGRGSLSLCRRRLTPENRA